MKKVLTTAILLALTATSAQAATINLRHEYSPEFGKNDAVQKDRIDVSHRFDNGVGFGVEAKWQSNTDGNDKPFDEFTENGHQANVSYRYKMGDSFTLTPQYKIETGGDKLNNQFNLTLGYKVNSDLSVSFRHRYNYTTVANEESSAHYNRWTFGAGYSGVENWGFGGSLDYTWKQEGDDVYDGNKSGVSEINFSGEYKGFESGWRPFGEFGVTPSVKNDGEAKDSWRPRFRVGLKYSF